MLKSMQVTELQAKTTKLEGASEQTAEELSRNEEQLQVLHSRLKNGATASAEKDKDMQQWLADFIDLKVRCPVVSKISQCY